MRQGVFCFHRYGAHGFQIFRHIFADDAVTARGAERKFAVFVYERNGKPVDFRFYGENGVFAEFFVCFVYEIVNLVIRKNIGKTAHFYVMRHFFEFFERFAADSFRGGRSAFKFGIFFFEGDKLVKKLIVFVIGNLRRILYIIKARMIFQQSAKLVYAFFCRGFFAFHMILP